MPNGRPSERRRGALLDKAGGPADREKVNAFRLAVVFLGVGIGLTAASCDSGGSAPDRSQPEADDAPASQVEPTDAPPDLLDLARALIPEEANAVAKEELAVEECGIAPAFPCVRAYFLIEDLDLGARVALIREQARSAGWRILSERRDGGVTIEIGRESLGATYMVEGEDPLFCKRDSLEAQIGEEGAVDAAPRCLAGTMVTVFGPPTPLPAPSEVERAAWSAAKRTYVGDANAVCKRMLAQASGRPDVFPEALGNGLKDLAALDAPAGEEDQVEEFLRPLRNLVRAARALSDDRGEDTLPAAVAVAEFAKRFNRAAARYGLDKCATVG
jgi:hypothetical protein